MEPSRLIPGDASLIENIVSYLKAKGIFDEFRHECLADVDTKSSCQNLNQRVDGYASKFLATETWNPDLNKNELRNKLRRHIDESGMLAGGADHVVEQVINPKIHTFFLPKIIEVVHQYIREQTELLHKKNEKPVERSAPTADALDSVTPKTKSAISDPIADILSFTQSKSKPQTTSSTQQKYTDLKKRKEEESKKKEEEPSGKKKEDEILSKKKDGENSVKKKEEEFLVKKKEETLAKKKDEETLPKKKEEDIFSKKEEETPAKEKEETFAIKKHDDEPTVEKMNIQEAQETITKNQNSSTATETKPITDKDKNNRENKTEEAESSMVQCKKKDECKIEEKKLDIEHPESNVGSKVDESKNNILPTVKSNATKKDPEKSKQKLKIADNVSKDAKKHKKELSEKSNKHHKHKSNKSYKEPSPTKNVNSSKIITKDEKLGYVSKSKSSNNKTSDSCVKKISRSDKSDSRNRVKHSDKNKSPKLNDSVKETSRSEPANNDKRVKPSHYSSSQDSSQGSDQEKIFKKEKQKHFSKHTKKDHSQKQSSSSASKHSSDKKYSSELSLKKHHKLDKSKNEKPKDITSELTKISSRSNSSGSGSSISCSSSASKEIFTTATEEESKSNTKDKKKKRKGSCQPPDTLPPPPPPPPPSGSLTYELTSCAEMSSMEDTQSSQDSEESSSDDSFSDSEVDVNTSLLDELEKMYKQKSAASLSDNDFYDIFLYSSSSSDFEGYNTSLEKINSALRETEMDVSVSSVHTSDLSSYDDELSDEELGIWDENESIGGKRLTLKKAQQLLQERATLRLNQRKDSVTGEIFQDDTIDSSNIDYAQKFSSYSSDDESCATETKRSLRRERKLNPRYASNEYTSIFNSKKETFITKQSPVKRIKSPVSSPPAEGKRKKRLSVGEKNLTQDIEKRHSTAVEKQKVSSKNSMARILNEYEIKKEVEDDADLEVQNLHIKTTVVEVKNISDHNTLPSNVIEINLSKANKNSSLDKEKISDNKVLMSVSEINALNSPLSSSHKMDSNMGEEQLFKENNKNLLLTELDLNPQSNSQLPINPHSGKRKMKMDEMVSAKRPCSRSSIDSSSSEPVANENNPFNSEMQTAVDDKLFIMCDLKTSEMNETVQNQFFCKQRTNNGDRLLLNSQGRTNLSERKAKDSSSNKELSAS